MFSRGPSICPSVRSTYVRPSAFRFHSITYSFINRFHLDFAYAFVLTMSRLRLLMGIFEHFIRVMGRVNVQKMFLASSFFTVWRIIMKLHKK